MKSKIIDNINIWLLLISFIVAIYLPFELFLFSYAFLGPLHYLTEINWLDDKRYFIKSKSQGYKIFIVFAIIIAIYPLIKYLELTVTGNLKTVVEFLGSQKNIILISGFVFSISLIFFTKLKHILLAFCFSVLFSIISDYYIPKIIIILAVFLPTLLHVYVFTLLFMIYGQLKTKNKAGIVSIIFLSIAPIVILFLNVNPENYVISDFVKSTFTSSGFVSVNNSIASLFGDSYNYKLISVIGVKIQIFIAFAYTYHYLNWFSKTSIIGWKSSITSTRMKYIVFFWIASVGLYLYDYVTGLIALFFLSLLHVVLEFPLNLTTIREIVLASVQKIKKPN
ncbi:hypothetical protein [uncultured Winogradskyella sp.]|uniref:hypothetical protein n=1 Tax=uncultured Winogradskyella sp. TaxID=395353 RepID=UPI002624DE3C|nr:hypothetical protein [uncultured Winogradskyella sp.]